MFVVSTIVITVFAVVAALLFILGLMKLYREKPSAKGLLTGGFVSALVGIVATAIIFNFFTL
jgi:NAD/NADP transhydrogenase beta subunit